MQTSSTQSQKGYLTEFLFGGSLVLRILIGMIAVIILSLIWPNAAMSVGIFGDIFVGALKAIAPVLVFGLVAASISSHKTGQRTDMLPILILYGFGTLLAALVAVTVAETGFDALLSYASLLSVLLGIC